MKPPVGGQGEKMTAHFSFDPIDMKIAGEALYGHEWQSKLAHALNVDPRRVRQWMAGERKPQPGVMQDIIALLEANRTEVAAALRMMRRKYKAPE